MFLHVSQHIHLHHCPDLAMQGGFSSSPWSGSQALGGAVPEVAASQLTQSVTWRLEQIISATQICKSLKGSIHYFIVIWSGVSVSQYSQQVFEKYLSMQSVGVSPHLKHIVNLIQQKPIQYKNSFQKFSTIFIITISAAKSNPANCGLSCGLYQ